MKNTMRYTVYNIYGISGESHHRDFEQAVNARDGHEGDGWVIQDEERPQGIVEPYALPNKDGGWDFIPMPLEE